MNSDKRIVLEKIAKSPIAGMAFMQGGCVGEVYCVNFENNYKLVAKTTENSTLSPNLHIEGGMLVYLREKSQASVPEPLIIEPDFLVMEFIETKAPTAKSATNLAHTIAELHAITNEFYGFESDTLVGPLAQPNPKSSTWIEFFAEHRLLHMTREARNKKAVSTAFCRQLETFLNRLHDYLNEPIKPALLHGDLWFGNILTRKDNSITLIDPAIYYGDPEIDIAYSQMFGGILPEFIAEYNNLRPLSENFYTERMAIYQLYPVLVHATLFGGHYGEQAEITINKFL